MKIKIRYTKLPKQKLPRFQSNVNTGEVQYDEYGNVIQSDMPSGANSMDASWEQTAAGAINPKSGQSPVIRKPQDWKPNIFQMVPGQAFTQAGMQYPSLQEQKDAAVNTSQGISVNTFGAQPSSLTGQNWMWSNPLQSEAPALRINRVKTDGTVETTGQKGNPEYTVYEQANSTNVGGTFKPTDITPGTRSTTKEKRKSPFNTLDYLSMASSVVDYANQRKKFKEFDRNLRRQAFDITGSASPEFEGNYDTNTGMFQPYRIFKPNEGMTMAEQGGELNNTMKIRITKGPQENMAYGGQSNYGLDLGRKKVYTDMTDSRSESVSNTLSGIPRYMANIEAEGGETVYGDIDGDGGLEHMKISGPRHSRGGVPLNVPEGSFVFSDTKKMKIKDPAILAKFGKSMKKGGITPAQIAKQYDINKYKAIMEDPYADPLAKSTAQLMVKNYESKLGQLALVQEGMKGFPGGIPQVAQNAMPQAAYGGYLPAYQGIVGPSTVEEAGFLPPYRPTLGGPGSAGLMGDIRNMFRLPASFSSSVSDLAAAQRAASTASAPTARTTGTARTASSTGSGDPVADVLFDRERGTEWYKEENYDKLKKLYFDPKYSGLRDKVYDHYKKVTESRGQQALPAEQFHNNFMEMQRGNYGLGRKYKDTPDQLVGGDWDKTKGKRYESEIAKLNEGITDEKLRYRALTGNNVGAAQQAAASLKEVLLTDPEAAKNFGKYARLSYTGKGNHFVTIDGKKYALSGTDNVAGDDTVNTILELIADPDKPQDVPEVKPDPVIGKRCNPDGSGVQTQTFSSEDEMLKAGFAKTAPPECSPGKIEVPDGNPGARFDFTTPDKLSMIAAASFAPKAYFPWSPNLSFRPNRLALQDWQAQAQNLQQSARAAQETLGTYQPGQALASNFSFLQGQTANNIANTINQTDLGNVKMFNDHTLREGARKDFVDQFNQKNMTDLYDKGVATKEAFRQESINAADRFVKSYANGWNNRMNLGLLNKTNPIYNIDPITGRSFFMNGYGPEYFSGVSGGAGNREGYWKGISDDYNTAKKFFGNDFTPQQYNQFVNRATTTSYDLDGDGQPDRTTTRKKKGGQINPLVAYLLGGFSFDPRDY